MKMKQKGQPSSQKSMCSINQVAQQKEQQAQLSSEQQFTEILDKPQISPHSQYKGAELNATKWGQPRFVENDPY